MKIGLRDLEYFAVVAEHGHVGRAADALGLSQPALSKSLRRFEQCVEAKLVRRTPRGVDLTAVGAALFGRVRSLRLSLEDISREAADLSKGRAGHIRVATGTAFGSHLLPLVCEAFHRQAPGVTLKVTTTDRNARYAGLRNGTLDVAIASVMPPHYEDLVEERLYEEEYVVLASTAHALAKRRQLGFRDVARERWVITAPNDPAWQRLNEIFGKAGLPPPVMGIEAYDMMLRRHMVATSSMLTFGSRNIARHPSSPRARIVELRVKGLEFSRSLGIIYRRDAYLSPAAQQFIDILKKVVREIAPELR